MIFTFGRAVPIIFQCSYVVCASVGLLVVEAVELDEKARRFLLSFGSVLVPVYGILAYIRALLTIMSRKALRAAHLFIVRYNPHDVIPKLLVN